MSDLDRRRMCALVAGATAAAALSPSERAWAGFSIRPGQRVRGELPAREASWYRSLEEGRVECQLCPRACQVAHAERGTCGVRENRDGTYMTLVHSLACSLHVDPIEKKPLYHVLPGNDALSYAAAGCNVECKFCQNWEISQFRPEQIESVWMPPEAMVRAARQHRTPLLAATYSEPVVFWEYVRDVSAAAQEAGLRSTVVSNGYIATEPLAEVLPSLTAVKVDLKAFTERFYEEMVRGELKPVLEALETIRAAGVWLEIVVLLIPTMNDSEGEIRDMAKWIAGTLGTEVPVHFTRFHPTYRLTNLPPTPVPTLERAQQVARAEGLQYVYLGNVPGHPAESTYCPSCGARLIHRLGFRIRANRITDAGHCPECDHTIPGVWK